MIEFPEFCNMMSDKMNAVNDEDMIRMAFRVLDKYGTGTISSKSFKHLMTHIGNTTNIKYKLRLTRPVSAGVGVGGDFGLWSTELFSSQLTDAV